MNYTDYTLGMLLNAKDETIKRNALSILKTLQRNAKNDPRKSKTKYCTSCGVRTFAEGWENGLCDKCWEDNN